jgi:hypothetical protein
VPLAILARMDTRDDELVTTADVTEVMAAIEAVDLAAPWTEVAPTLRPALPRRRPLPSGTDDLPSVVYPPGIRATLALDIGPAILFVGRMQLAGWGVSEDHAFARALRNVRGRVRRRRQFALVHERICGQQALAFQSREGWAAALLLMPDELARVFGHRDGIVIAPMRDLVIHLPVHADPLIALLVLEEFAQADMNALELPAYRLVNGRLAVAGEAPAGGAPLLH